MASAARVCRRDSCDGAGGAGQRTQQTSCAPGTGWSAARACSWSFPVQASKVCVLHASCCAPETSRFPVELSCPCPCNDVTPCRDAAGCPAAGRERPAAGAPGRGMCAARGLTPPGVRAGTIGESWAGLQEAGVVELNLPHNQLAGAPALAPALLRALCPACWAHPENPSWAAAHVVAWQPRSECRTERRRQAQASDSEQAARPGAAAGTDERMCMSCASSLTAPAVRLLRRVAAGQLGDQPHQPEVSGLVLHRPEQHHSSCMAGGRRLWPEPAAHRPQRQPWANRHARRLRCMAGRRLQPTLGLVPWAASWSRGALHVAACRDACTLVQLAQLGPRQQTHCRHTVWGGQLGSLAGSSLACAPT